MKLLTSFILLISINLSVNSIVHAAENKSENFEAKELLSRLSNSLKRLNFSTSFVVVKNNQAEPYHWFHGVNKDNIELVFLIIVFANMFE